jgi:hypothetical protein
MIGFFFYIDFISFNVAQPPLFLRCVELYLNGLQLSMYLPVWRSLEPHCSLKQRRWINS